ncbi:MAG: ATP-binding protein [Candidatus Omnitrophica bacterium]|nr:ATP-binding protein [Candidatus Omnitrophota bacterium]
MIERVITKIIKKAAKNFPAVVLTGPRQSGKTTLLKNILKSTHTYINLEDPDMRMRAREDPKLFLSNFSGPQILDEIQYVPELLPYIKSSIDNNRAPGHWFLTGSQNFKLMKGVSESLAGRAAVLSLLPFSFNESSGLGKSALDMAGLLKSLKIRGESVPGKSDIGSILRRGGYPEPCSNKKVDINIWCSSYVSTYFERDIRNLSQIGDLGEFERFVRVCAARTGQILNLSEMAKEIGISVPTAKKWLSLLETGYQVLLLYPYYKNIGKRLIKSPKLYFTDTALVCYLLGIKSNDVLLNGPSFPAIFETFVVVDFWKRFLNAGDMGSLFYLRTRDGFEVDLVIESGQELFLFEIKSGGTITGKHAATLMKAGREIKNVKECAIVSRSDKNFTISKGVSVYNWHSLLGK